MKSADHITSARKVLPDNSVTGKDSLEVTVGPNGAGYHRVVCKVGTSATPRGVSAMTDVAKGTANKKVLARIASLNPEAVHDQDNLQVVFPCGHRLTVVEAHRV